MTAITQVPLSDTDAAAVGLAAFVMVVLVYLIGRYTPAPTQVGAAYAVTWLLQR